MSSNRDVVPPPDVEPEVRVWLAGPPARPLFAPEAQTPEDQARWRQITSPRRREEWEVSRALLAHARSWLVAQYDAAATTSAGLNAVPAHSEPLANSPWASVTAAPGNSGPTGAGPHDAAVRRGRPIAFPPAGSEPPSVPQQTPAPHASEGTTLSLSHSGGYAAVVASRTAMRVGVDLECARPRDAERLARFAFSEQERAQLEALPAEARAERFYILWTLKEAFAKALALPLLASLSRCTFVEERGAWRGSVPTDGEWVAQVFRPSPVLVLSVVVLLPRGFLPGNLRVLESEWPEAATRSWGSLVTLHSGRT